MTEQERDFQEMCALKAAAAELGKKLGSLEKQYPFPEYWQKFRELPEYADVYSASEKIVWVDRGIGYLNDRLQCLGQEKCCLNEDGELRLHSVPMF